MSSDKIHVSIECDLTLAQIRMLLTQGKGNIFSRDNNFPSLRQTALPDIKKVNPATLPVKTVEKILRDHFHVEVTELNISKYRLYFELAPIGFKTLYSGTFVSEKELFTEKFDIDHIVPKAQNGNRKQLWNKVLTLRSDNAEKADKSLLEYAENWTEEHKDWYRKSVSLLWREGVLSRKKYRRLFVV